MCAACPPAFRFPFRFRFRVAAVEKSVKAIEKGKADGQAMKARFAELTGQLDALVAQAQEVRAVVFSLVRLPLCIQQPFPTRTHQVSYFPSTVIAGGGPTDSGGQRGQGRCCGADVSQGKGGGGGEGCSVVQEGGGGGGSRCGGGGGAAGGAYDSSFLFYPGLTSATLVGGEDTPT